ncbi:unnamed protein product [Rodentolepis nana]|uniref:Lysosomal cobalamin transporter n=1 Tax=Rodentolepis nana TaxID=102285 RepID=A0A0R3SZX7_RODNA|nr:unnamed protein product [Rodentolepis nana]
MGDKGDGLRSCCSTFGKALKYEFKWRHLGFGGAYYEHFPFAQWMWMDKFFYPIYRFIIAVALIIWVCVEVPLRFAQYTDDYMKKKYFLYATNWSFLIFTLSCIVFAILCTFYKCKKGKVICFRINNLPAEVGAETLSSAHFMNFGIVYCTFSYIYYITCNEKPIYSTLDWSRPKKALIVSLTMIVSALVMQILLYILYLCRIALSSRMNERGKVVVDMWREADS